MATEAFPTTGAGPVSLEAAVFDMDGLLIDSEPVWREAEIRIFGRLGVPLTDQLCHETKGMVVDEVTRYWYQRHGWTGPSPEAVAAEIIDTMVSLLADSVVLKPGALRAVTTCRDRGLALAIASSSPQRVIEVVVDRLGMADVFAVLHSAQEEEIGKPDPAVFLSAAALLGVEPRRCVVFEDSAAGVRAALAAGMICVAVPEVDLAVSPAEAETFAAADLVLATLDDVTEDFWARLAPRVARESSA